MKTIKTTVLLTLITSVFLLFSCAKDGKDGLPGPAGANGNANVKSQTFTIYSWDWTTSGNMKYVDINSNLITTDIVNSGSVLIYMKFAGFWQALPFTYPQGTTSQLFRYYYSNNFVQIQVTQETGVPSLPDFEFKLVVISSSARLSNPQMNFTDYYQVKDVFHLKD